MAREIAVERFLTNAIADAAAGAGATTANAGLKSAEFFGATLGHASNLIKRFASIEAARWDIGDGLTDKPTPLPEFIPRLLEEDYDTIKEVKKQVGHEVIQEGRWARCIVRNGRRKRTNFEFWTKSECPGARVEGGLKSASSRLKRSR